MCRGSRARDRGEVTGEPGANLPLANSMCLVPNHPLTGFLSMGKLSWPPVHRDCPCSKAIGESLNQKKGKEMNSKPDKMNCPACGRPIDSGLAVCRRCGHRFRDAASQSQSPQPSDLSGAPDDENDTYDIEFEDGAHENVPLQDPTVLMPRSKYRTTTWNSRTA